MHLDEGWDLYTALAGSASFFGYELYTGFGALYLRLEDLSGSLVRGIGLDVGFEHTSNDFGGGDAPWLDLSTSLGWDALVSDLDWLELSAVLEYYFADQPVYAYGQLEAMLGYGFTPIDRLEISCSVMGYRRVYDAPWTEGLSDRRDWLLRADVGLLYTGLFLEPLALELTGAYEQNWSNDPVQSYDGGSASIVLHWIF